MASTDTSEKRVWPRDPLVFTRRCLALVWMSLENVGVRTAVVKLRVAPERKEAWKAAAGDRGLSAFMASAADRELERREEERLAAERAAIEARESDPLNELLAEYGA